MLEMWLGSSLEDLVVSDAIYEILNWIGGDDLEGFAWGVLWGVLFVAFLGVLFERHRHAVPGLMTSLGILGTFCGIFLALQPLNLTSVEDMTASVPKLLEGMKKAFVTSLIGISGAIFFRVITPVLPSFSSQPKVVSPEQQEVLSRLDAIKEAISGDADASVTTQLQKTRTDTGDSFKASNEKLDAVRQAIAGDGEATLVTQMQMLRNETRDGFKDLNKGFEDLKKLEETIRESLVNNLSSLVTSIRDVLVPTLQEQFGKLIKDIQKALIEQFGQTFKEFNAATQAIKQWQEEHKEQVEQLTAAFNHAATGMQKIREDCAVIPPTMESLREIVELARGEVTTLHQQLSAFAAMREQAEDAFPTIKRNLEEVGEKLAQSAAGFGGLKESIEKTFEDAATQARRVTEEHAVRVKEMSDTIQATLKKTQQEASQEVGKIMVAATRKLREEMDSEIDRVARAWGGNLVSIAEKCDEAIKRVEGLRQP